MKKSLFTLFLTAFCFVLSQSQSIIITEINYNDPTSGADVYEYIELYNNSSSTINMQGWTLSKAVDFTFPAYNLQPGEYVIVAVDSVAFEQAFQLPAFKFDGGLNNTGETILLSNSSGAFADSVAYRDSGDWPSQPDGNGPSLVLCDYDADNNNPANWKAASTGSGLVVNGVEMLVNPGEDSECSSGGPVYPPYSIGAVTSVNAAGIPDSLGKTCTLTGIVHGVNLQGATSSAVQFALIDQSGGISVFSNDNFGYSVLEGDEVSVQGTITQFNCLSQITPDTLWKVSGSNPTVTPAVVTTLDENAESELVQINNLTFVDPSQWQDTAAVNSSGFTVDVTNGTQSFSLRIDKDVNLYLMPLPATPFNLRGIGGQFDNAAPCDLGYQILPRYAADIFPVTGTDEKMLAPQIRLSPNPTGDWIQIETDLKIDAVTITDSYGRRLREVKNPGDLLPLEGLRTGLFLLTFYAEGTFWTARILKK
jgi:hypothetical protein